MARVATEDVPWIMLYYQLRASTYSAGLRGFSADADDIYQWAWD